MVASHSLLAIDNSLQLSPPLHVDVLWHSHILETRRYREFEEIVLEAYRQSGRSTDLQFLDHSIVDNKIGREDRIKKTKGFYQMLGFTFVNTAEEEEEKDDEDSSVKFLEVITKNRSDISLTSNSNQSSKSSSASCQLVEDHNVDLKEHIQELKKNGEKEEEVQKKKTTEKVADSDEGELEFADKTVTHLKEILKERERSFYGHKGQRIEQFNKRSIEESDSDKTTDNVAPKDNGLVVQEALQTPKRSISINNQIMKNMNVTVPPGPLGLNISSDARGVFVKEKKGEQTKLLARDIILSVDHVPVKTADECANALLKQKDKYRTLLIKRKVLEDLAEQKVFYLLVWAVKQNMQKTLSIPKMLMSTINQQKYP